LQLLFAPPKIKMKPYQQVQLEDRKVVYLEWLYCRDRRDSPEHPLHDTYTGLLEDRMNEILDEDFAIVTGGPRR
jgi:hypothetical protein